MDNFMIRPRITPELWPIEEEDEKYYYINGETDDYSGYPVSSSGFDETDESGTGEDVYPDDEEEEEEEEETEEDEKMSLDGSDLSEGSTENVRALMKQQKSATAPGGLDSMKAMSETFLQQVM